MKYLCIDFYYKKSIEIHELRCTYVNKTIFVRRSHGHMTLFIFHVMKKYVHPYLIIHSGNITLRYFYTKVLLGRRYIFIKKKTYNIRCGQSHLIYIVYVSLR